MKENEAPKKIYISVVPSVIGGYETITCGKDFPNAVEYTRTDTFIEKAKKAFCKASCNGHPPRSTCTSFGTCQKYDEFIKMMKGK